MTSNASILSVASVASSSSSNKSQRSRFDSDGMFQKVDKGSDKGQHIQVAVRVRPLNDSERKHGSANVIAVNPAKKEIVAKEKGNPHTTKTYHFDKVFGTNSTQIEVYREVVVPILDEVLMGYNCTIFAYGQTGTGKTFTMEGERSPGQGSNLATWESDPLAGVIPRTLHQLFETLMSQEAEFTIRVSFIELYNEELFDLLAADNAPGLRLFDDPVRKGSVVLQGLEEVIVRSKDEVYEILDRGAKKRATAATLLNAHSSRSHSVFSVTVHIRETQVDGEDMLKTGKLYLVDLAGSENIGRSGAVGKRACEAGNINQSLLTLGRVITALVEHARHIPYRESKLTRLLQDSLGGRTKTCIIATISPSSNCHEETVSTLEYAFRAKNITNKPEVNQKVTKKTLLKEYADEIEGLRRDLQAAREKNGIFLTQERHEEMTQKLTSQGDLIKELEDKLAGATLESGKIVGMFAKTQEELDASNTKLRKTMEKLEKTKTKFIETKSVYLEAVKTRDENKFLLEEHQEKENILHGQAQELVSLNEKALQNINMLHGKLDRTKAVQESNERHFGDYRNAVKAHVEEMKQSLTSFSAVHQELEAEEIRQIGSMTENAGSRYTATKTALVNLNQAFESKMTDMNRKFESKMTGMNSAFEAKMMELNSTFDSKMMEIITTTTNMMKTVKCEFQAQATAVTDEFVTQANAAKGEFQTYSNEAKGEFQARAQAILSQLDDTYESVEGGLKAVKATQDKRKDAVSKYEDDGDGQLQALETMADDLVLIKIAKDAPTGQTPSRQSTQYKIQKELARPSPRDRLLERFKDQYQPPPIPLDNSILEDSVDDVLGSIENDD